MCIYTYTYICMHIYAIIYMYSYTCIYTYRYGCRTKETGHMDQVGECKREPSHGATQVHTKAIYDVLPTPVNLHAWV